APPSTRETPTWSVPWRSAPTGKCWPWAATTRRSSCGTWPAGSRAPPSKGHAGIVYSVAFSPDGKAIASASTATTIKLWDGASEQQRATLQGHTNSVNSVAFSADGKALASGGDDRTVKLWDVASEE